MQDLGEPATLSAMFGLTTMALLFGPQVLAVVLSILWALRKPGGMGHMTRRREVIHDDMTVDQAKELYKERLLYEGFVIAEEMEAELLAVREPTGGNTAEAMSEKEVGVAMFFEQDGESVFISALGRFEDFIIADTGEGRYMDRLMDRLMESDLDREAAPEVPMLSFQAFVAMLTALMMTVPPLLIAARVYTAPGSIGLALGEFFPMIAVFIFSAIGIRNARNRPSEVRGATLAGVAILLAITAQITAITLLFVYYGPEWIQTALEEMTAD